MTRILWPKMRKRSGRLGGKGAPGSARSAILNFLAAAKPHELAPLLYLFMEPLSSCFSKAFPSDTNVHSRYDIFLRTMAAKYRWINCYQRVFGKDRVKVQKLARSSLKAILRVPNLCGSATACVSGKRRQLAALQSIRTPSCNNKVCADLFKRHQGD